MKSIEWAYINNMLQVKSKEKANPYLNDICCNDVVIG